MCGFVLAPVLPDSADDLLAEDARRPRCVGDLVAAADDASVRAWLLGPAVADHRAVTRSLDASLRLRLL